MGMMFRMNQISFGVAFFQKVTLGTSCLVCECVFLRDFLFDIIFDTPYAESRLYSNKEIILSTATLQ